MVIPKEYITQVFLKYNGDAKYQKHQDVYIGSCYICKEGTSWLKKKRCYLYLESSSIFCFNCGWHGSALKWIKEVTNKTTTEILEESKNYELVPQKNTQRVKKNTIERLPHDCINLFDTQQLSYYSSNSVVQDALDLLKRRRLLNAVNRPQTLYVSLSDFVHKERLVIPYFDLNNKITFYQSRALYKEQEEKTARYLGKISGEKTLFNINQIDKQSENIFILEGPLNAFFIKNGIAVGGIQEKSFNLYTQLQQHQIGMFPMHKKIWLLDSQWVDSASLQKTKKLIDVGENVFIWPEVYGKKYKDINDFAIDRKLNEIPVELITRNTFSGLQAKLKLSEITL